MFGLIPYRYRTNEISGIGNDIFSDAFFRPFFFGESFPEAFRVDVRDDGDHYRMEAELPGLNRDQIHVDVEDGNLTISAEWCNEDRQKDGYIVNERRCGSVRRSFTLNDVEEEGISAQYENGVLTLNLPKRREEKITGRHIEIQ